MYYLNARYYNPKLCRFISPDSILGANGDLFGYNLYAYCSNNPVMSVDSNSNRSIPFCYDPIRVAYCEDGPLPCVLCPRQDLASADSLLGKSADELNDLDVNSFNCYGNGIGKQIYKNPTGYYHGQSTRDTFIAVRKDLGFYNVRELKSIDDPIGNDEFKVAIRCGPYDFHFIRQLDNGTWYNKSGIKKGVCISKDTVVNGLLGNGIWFAMYIEDNTLWYGLPYYDDEIIYFALKKDWYKK